MYVMKFLKIWHFYLCIKGVFSLTANQTDIGLCNNEGKVKCCADYRNVSGRCEPCLGSFGEACEKNCPNGYYGHGCRNKCDCLPTEPCHEIHGCLTNRTGHGDCYDELTGKLRCCSDYRNVSGRCEPCLGSFGFDCNITCPDGYYGHGCRNKCDCLPTESCHEIHGCLDCIGSFGENCSQPCSFGFFGYKCKEECNCSSDTHWCDNILGCKIKDVHNQSQEIRTKHLTFEVVGSITGTSAFWFLTYLVCSWKRKSTTTMDVTMQEAGHSGNILGESQRQPERNSPAVESGRHVRSKSCQHGAKNLKPITRSRSLSQDTYGRFNRRSGDYDHLDLHGHHTQPSVFAFSSNYSKIKLQPS
ncbi:multiple epidermal growth factor-like domains protein 6 isoform X2 [Ostrea edulis]|uniref:multiple epidermal growth factor-like domains protein 6 isoform X2 n=1 Tax=Ostrea edulis TaxID=37623 RepID=UPI0024AEC735|nr:multiple epidermal growth factor-like domains protein 6 isoform X2 [Ostrea edulis]